MPKVKPKCELLGCDGTVFMLAGRVTKALKRAGLDKEAAEFSERLDECKTQDKALRLMMKYIEVA